MYLESSNCLKWYYNNAQAFVGNTSLYVRKAAWLHGNHCKVNPQGLSFASDYFTLNIEMVNKAILSAVFWSPSPLPPPPRALIFPKYPSLSPTLTVSDHVLYPKVSPSFNQIGLKNKVWKFYPNGAENARWRERHVMAMTSSKIFYIVE